MGDADPYVLHKHDQLLRQLLPQRRLVDVAEDGVHRRPERAEILEGRERRVVASVEDQVCLAQPAYTLVGQQPRASREVRVADRSHDHGSPGA
jgi:hypothetical protein